MSRSRPTPPQTGSLALQGDLDVFSIRQQWEELAAAIAMGPSVLTLDLAGLGDLDPSGFQLLATLDRDLRAAGGRLVLVGIQDDWKSRFERLGLGTLNGEASA